MSKERVMRAKMVVTEVHRSGFLNGDGYQKQDRIKCVAVAAKSYPSDGADEDNTYARFSPSGEITLTIANPALVGVIEPGRKFYIDFISAD